MTWCNARLGDACTLKRGYDLPEGCRVDGDVPVVSSSGITGYHNEKKVEAPGVVTGRYGTLGEVFYVEQDYWPLNTALYVRDFKGNVPRFIAYFLKNVLHGRQSDKAAVPGVNRNVLHEVPVRIPTDIPTQQSIANVLSAYDDMIENNRRRISLMLESARLLYCEWFEHLRFPGHEHARVVNGVPEGWTTYKLDDLCKVGRGASPRPINDYMDGEVPWFKIGDATASESPFVFETKEHVTEDGAKKSVSMRANSLILSNSATCGIPFFTGVKGCIHDGWLHFSDLQKISAHFLYYLFISKQQELLSSVGDGSTQKNLNTTAVGRLQVALPATDVLLDQFNDVASHSFALIQVLARQNLVLRTARDLLLPRLMSGEIAV